MITVKLTRDEDGQYFKFTVSGHANYAEKGKDIVCAGVSAITQSVLYTLKEYALVESQIEIPRGYLEAEVVDDTHKTKEVQAIFKVLETGLLALETEYLDYIEVLDSNTE